MKKVKCPKCKNITSIKLGSKWTCGLCEDNLKHDIEVTTEVQPGDIWTTNHVSFKIVKVVNSLVYYLVVGLEGAVYVDKVSELLKIAYLKERDNKPIDKKWVKPTNKTKVGTKARIKTFPDGDWEYYYRYCSTMKNGLAVVSKDKCDRKTALICEVLSD